MKNLNQLIIYAIIVLSITIVGGCEQDGMFNKNIIKNGDAEAGPSIAGEGKRQVPNYWTDVEGQMWISIYGEGAGGSEIAEADVRGEGENYFWGGKNTNSTIEQLVDLSSIEQEIDAGKVSYELSGLLGGYRSQNDRAKLVVDFLDANHDVIQSTQIGFVTAGDRDNDTRMVRRESTGIVPVNTGIIRFRLIALLEAGANNDGYADDLSMVLRK